MQQSLHLRRIDSGICPANPFACDVAGEVVQFQSDCQSLLARHLTVTVNLFFQGGSRIHNLSIVYLRLSFNSLESVSDVVDGHACGKVWG
jgi:hypothetical protein